MPLGSVVLAALAVAWFLFSYDYLEDDAFIHLEFARSVAEGSGFAFNGMVTNGDTAPLWALLLAAVHSLGVGWTQSAKVACVFGLCVALSGIWRISYDLAPARIGSRGFAAAMVAITVINPFFVDWSFSGMETLAAVGVSLWAIWLIFVGAPSGTRLTLGAVLVGIGPLLRPEFMLLDAITGPVVLWKAWHLAPGQSSAGRVARVAGLTVLMVLPLISWCLYALHAFGSIVPNTNIAKRGGPLAHVAPRLAAVYAVGFPITLALLPMGLARLRQWRSIQPAVWILIGWPIVCILFYLADHTDVQTRYCLLSMPALTIAVFLLVSSFKGNLLFRGGLALALVVALLTVMVSVVPHVQNKKEGVHAFAAVSTFVRDNVPAQAPVAIFAIGEVAFNTRHPLVDIGGITRPGVVPYMSDRKQTLRWAKENGAQYYVGDGGVPESGATALFSTPVPYLGWSLNPARYRAKESLTLYKLP